MDYWWTHWMCGVRLSLVQLIIVQLPSLSIRHCGNAARKKKVQGCLQLLVLTLSHQNEYVVLFFFLYQYKRNIIKWQFRKLCRKRRKKNPFRKIKRVILVLRHSKIVIAWAVCERAFLQPAYVEVVHTKNNFSMTS